MVPISDGAAWAQLVLAPAIGLSSGAGTTGFVSSPKLTRVGQKKKSVSRDRAKTASSGLVKNANTKDLKTELVTGAVLAKPVRRRLPEEDPFAPVGFRAGAFLARPAIEIVEGYDSNPLRVSGGAQGSRFTTIAPELIVRSLWPRHEISAELKGSYTAFSDILGNDRPAASVLLRGRIDATTTSQIEIGTRALLTTQSAGSPDSILSAVRPPHVYSFGGMLGLVQRFNRFEFALRGSADHVTHESAKLISGDIDNLSDRDFASYALALRGSYEMKPGIKPFFETGMDRRVFDREVDFDGIIRGSDGGFVRLGIGFERRGFLIGEASAGFSRRNYSDPLLPGISGLILDSSLLWTVTPLTSVRLLAKSSVEETSLDGASGIFRREAKIIVDHALRRWLIGSLSLSYGIEDYPGANRCDDRLGIGAGFTYQASRTLAVRGELRRERLSSNVVGQDYIADIALVGVRLQR